MSATTVANQAKRTSGLNASLWVVQGLLALTFVGTGLWKLFTPISELSAMIPWTGQVSPALVTTIAVIDLLGGIGVLLPSLTRVQPGLVVFAALGCAALMFVAAVFHIGRGEASNTPFNFLLLALSLFVAWGRQRKVPIPSRS